MKLAILSVLLLAGAALAYPPCCGYNDGGVSLVEPPSVPEDPMCMAGAVHHPDYAEWLAFGARDFSGLCGPGNHQDVEGFADRLSMYYWRAQIIDTQYRHGLCWCDGDLSCILVLNAAALSSIAYEQSSLINGAHVCCFPD